MPDPTTLIEFAQQEQAAYQAAQTDARDSLASAQAVLASARREHTADTEAFADVERQTTAKRAALASTTIPAEAAELLGELTALLIESRTLQGELIADADAVSAAEAAFERATTRLTRAGRKLATAEAALAAATLESARSLAWTTALTQPPLSTLKADAAAVLASAEFTAAETKITDDLPAKLLESARSRYVVQAERLEGREQAAVTAEDLLAAQHESDGGPEGEAAKRRIEFARAEHDVRDHAEQARDRFDRAMALLADFQGPLPLLSPAEKTRVDDATLTADGEAAADLGKARDDARKTVQEKRAVLDDAILEAQAADPNADVASESDVIDAQGELDAAQAALDAAQAAFEAEHDDLLAWAAIIPDAAWRRVLGFLEAEAILQELDATDPAVLTSALTTAEEALAGALAAAARSARSIAFLQDAAVLRRQQLANAQKNRQTRLLSAVRGDS